MHGDDTLKVTSWAQGLASQGIFDEVAERADLALGGLVGHQVADERARGEGVHEDRAVADRRGDRSVSFTGFYDQAPACTPLRERVFSC
jgi:hypothetical protein